MKPFEGMDESLTHLLMVAGGRLELPYQGYEPCEETTSYVTRNMLLKELSYPQCFIPISQAKPKVDKDQDRYTETNLFLGSLNRFNMSDGYKLPLCIFNINEQSNLKQRYEIKLNFQIICREK
jgi:hypothetical protein